MSTTELPRKYRSDDDMPQVGHIISSKEFARGSYNCATIRGKPAGKIEINSPNTTRNIALHGPVMMLVIQDTGNPNHPDDLDVDVRCNDPSRGEARYIVISAQKTGGFDASFITDHPHGWRVTARRLTPEGIVDMNAPVIEFYNEPMRWHKNYVSPSEITFHGTMPVPTEALQGIY